MTLIAAHRLHDVPVLVGDALCTVIDSAGSVTSKSLKKKVYIIGPNLAVGWTDFAISAQVVISELLARFSDRQVTRSELEEFLTSLSFDGMQEREVKLIGWLIDDRPSPFLWRSGYSSEVFYDETYFEGSGEQYFESLLNDVMLSGIGPPKTGAPIDSVKAAAHRALSHAAQAFFSEQLDDKWTETFGFAYEVVVYGYGRFWPLKSTVYVPWTYWWDDKTETGHPELAPMMWKMNFLGPYSVIQRVHLDGLKILKLGYLPIKPVYPYRIDRDLKKMRFNLSSEIYVHYFVLHPPQTKDRRVSLCIVGDRFSDKVAVEASAPFFTVNTKFLDDKFRQAIQNTHQ